MRPVRPRSIAGAGTSSRHQVSLPASHRRRRLSPRAGPRASPRSRRGSRAACLLCSPPACRPRCLRARPRGRSASRASATTMDPPRAPRARRAATRLASTRPTARCAREVLSRWWWAPLLGLCVCLVKPGRTARLARPCARAVLVAPTLETWRDLAFPVLPVSTRAKARGAPCVRPALTAVRGRPTARAAVAARIRRRGRLGATSAITGAKCSLRTAGMSRSVRSETTRL